MLHQALMGSNSQDLIAIYHHKVYVFATNVHTVLHAHNILQQANCIKCFSNCSPLNCQWTRPTESSGIVNLLSWGERGCRQAPTCTWQTNNALHCHCLHWQFYATCTTIASQAFMHQKCFSIMH